MDQSQNLQHKKHANYFKRFLNLLPPRLASHDSTRVTIAFFAVCGLDVLDALEVLQPATRKNIIDWMYRYQVAPAPGGLQCGGLQGSSTVLVSSDCETESIKCYQWGHLAMTYTGIATLATLGDDLTRLNRKAILEGVGAVQRNDGSFSASVEGNEYDMRFVYCAAAICAMLDDWSYVNKQKMAEYIISSIRYDYGVSQHFENESHGGTTFCAIAALHLSDQLHLLSPEILEGMTRWLLFRQIDGFQGRPNKPVDTCYSFWIGASLKILDAFEFTDFEQNRDYILATQDTVVGGFSKWPGSSTDPFHTYFGICGLSFIGEKGLLEVIPSLNISARALDHLRTIHKRWRANGSLHTTVDIE